MLESAEFVAIGHFLARRALRAIMSISERSYDPGHIRDLADAAFFGHAEAALTLARVTLASDKTDGQRKFTEALAWFEFALVLGYNRTWVTRVAKEVADMRRALSQDILDKSEAIVQHFKRRVNDLRANPFE